MSIKCSPPSCYNNKIIPRLSCEMGMICRGRRKGGGVQKSRTRTNFVDETRQTARLVSFFFFHSSVSSIRF